MLRRSHILTAVAVLVAFAALVPSAYAIYPPGAFEGDGQSPPPPPPSSIAQSSGQAYQDLRSPDARDAKTEPVNQVAQDLRSPDARDAAGTYAEPVTQVAQDLRSPDARDAAEDAKIEVAQDLRSPDARDAGLPEAPTPDTVVEIREVPSTGFDWGDAGIGAAGLLALLSIAGGLTLMVTTRRRRHGSEMPAH